VLRRSKEAEALLLECHAALAGKSESAKDLEAVRESLAQVYTLLGRPERAADYRPSGRESPREVNLP